MIERLVRNYSDEPNEIDIYLERFSLKDLVNLYLTGANPVYYKNYMNYPEIVDLVLKHIISKVSDSSLIDIIDLSTEISIKITEHNHKFKTNQNIINSQNSYLEDENLAYYNAKSKSISVSDYLEECRRKILNFESDNVYVKQSLEKLEKLQGELQVYIDYKINDLDDESIRLLLIEINNRIESNAYEILQINELKNHPDASMIYKKIHEKEKDLSDEQKIYSDVSVIYKKIREKEILDILSMFDISSFIEKNMIYEGYQTTLRNYNYKNSKGIKD